MFKLKVPSMVESAKSETFYMEKIPWHIYAKFEGSFAHCTPLVLYLCYIDKNATFKHKVNATLKIISTINENRDILVRETAYRPLPSVTKTCEYDNIVIRGIVSHFDLNDSAKGLITNGTITIKLDARILE